MKAAVYNQYGSPQVLSIQEIPIPTIGEKQILVEVKASAANSADMRIRKADPWMVKIVYGIFGPKNKVLGVTFSGVVSKIGSKVTNYKVSDQVFGMCEKTMGSYAQYMAINCDEAFTIKPNNISHIEAASIPFGLTTAMHFLNKCNLKAGQSILIYGASGSVGTAVIQLAKSKGAIVTAISSDKNIDFVKSLGADYTLSYDKIKIEDIEQKYDVVYETVNKTDLNQISKLVKNNGSLIIGAGLIKEMLVSIFLKKRGIKIIQGVAIVSSQMMQELKSLIENNTIKPVVDKVFTLDQIKDAHMYLETGHKKGNISIDIENMNKE